MFLTAQSIIFSIGHRRRMKPIENSRVCVKTATKLKKHPPKKVPIFGRIRVIGQGDETTKMNKPVGYLTKYPDGVAGDRGLYYNYILAANGLFIEAESPFITARVPVAYCEIRGLGKLEPRVSLTYGSIPHRFWDRRWTLSWLNRIRSVMSLSRPRTATTFMCRCRTRKRLR